MTTVEQFNGLVAAFTSLKAPETKMETRDYILRFEELRVASEQLMGQFTAEMQRLLMDLEDCRRAAKLEATQRKKEAEESTKSCVDERTKMMEVIDDNVARLMTAEDGHLKSKRKLRSIMSNVVQVGGNLPWQVKVQNTFQALSNDHKLALRSRTGDSERVKLEFVSQMVDDLSKIGEWVMPGTDEDIAIEYLVVLLMKEVNETRS